MSTISHINGPLNKHERPTIYGYWAIPVHIDNLGFIGGKLITRHDGSSFRTWCDPGFGVGCEDYWGEDGLQYQWVAQSLEGWYDKTDAYSNGFKYNLLKGLMGEPMPEPEWFEPRCFPFHLGPFPPLEGELPPRPIYVPPVPGYLLPPFSCRP